MTTRLNFGPSARIVECVINVRFFLFQAGKMGLGPTHPGAAAAAAALPFFCHNGDPLSQPPPAHMGIPPYQLDGKAGSMGEYGVGGRGGGSAAAPPPTISPADWRRLGPLLAATGSPPMISSPHT